MRYYCGITEMEYSASPCADCRNLSDKKHCGDNPKELLTYETVAQWEQRRGEKYPDTAPVYVHCPSHEDTHIWVW